jgi:hypothetical protein
MGDGGAKQIFELKNDHVFFKNLKLLGQMKGNKINICKF